MSFINLMADYIWTEADIVRRTEAIVRSQFSAEDEQILNRKVTGQMLGQYTLTPAEQAEMQAFAIATEAARQQGTNARTDNALLAQTLPVEAANARLALPLVAQVTDDSGNVVNQADIDQDMAERGAAQLAVAGASQAVLDLINQRASFRGQA